MKNIRTAVIYSSVTSFLTTIVGLISTMVIARMLTPEEIGTYAIASSMVMILSEIRLLGAGPYLVREEVITKNKIRAALGLTILISWGIGIGVVVSSSIIANFYDLPSIKILLIVLSINFFIAPYISMPLSLLSRSYDFKSLFYVKVSRVIITFISAVILILLDYGYYSLAWGYTLGFCFSFILLFFLWPSNAPLLPTFKGIKIIALFGVYTSVSALLQRTTLLIPDLVIGKMGTTYQVAIFSKGFGFINFIKESVAKGIRPVALPFLSNAQRTNSDINNAYIKASILMGGIIWPVLAVASIVSLPAIRIFFGEQWDLAAPIASVLCFWGLFKSFHLFSNALLISTKHEKSMLIKNLIMFIIYLITVIITYPLGLKAVAIGYTSIGLVELIYITVLINKLIGLNLIKLFYAWLPTFIVTGICFIATLLISLWVDFSDTNPFYPMTILVTIIPLVWIISLKLLNHTLYFEITNMTKKLFSQLNNNTST